MTEKKLKYQKPAMQVFELPRRQQLLVGSGGSRGVGNREDYQETDDNPFSGTNP